MQDWSERKPSIVFLCDDVNQTYEELKTNGVAVGDPPRKMKWGSFATVQRPPRE